MFRNILKKKDSVLLRAGKKEGVWGRNFCLPALFSLKFSPRPYPRRPKGRGRRGPRLHMKSWLLFFGIFFKISPNLTVKAAPNGKSRFIGAIAPRILQFQSHFLPRDPEVRLHGAQSSANAEQPIFCLSPSVKIPNFHSAGGGTKNATIFLPHLPMLMESWAVDAVCPKAITNKAL